MRDKRRSLPFPIVLCVIVFVLGHSDSYASDSHLKRGTDWMDLKRYDNARQEFLLVINEEPKNVEPRYQIALSYYLEGNLTSAIEWCAETISVSPRHAKTQDLMTKISADTEKQLLHPDDRVRLTGLGVLRELLDRHFVNPDPIVREKVQPLLKSSSDNVVNRSFDLLKREGVDVEGLSMLAKEGGGGQRQKALRLIQDSADNRYLPVLRVLATDELEPIKEEAALLLLDKYGDSTANPSLAGIYHRHLQKEIGLGRTERSGLELDDRVSKIARLAPKLGDASFAGEFAELLCVGRVYGFLSTDLINSIVKIGKPGLPYLKEVLNREADFRELLRKKRFDSSQIDWRFRRIKDAIRAFEGL